MAKKITADEQTNPAEGEIFNPVPENTAPGNEEAKSPATEEEKTPLEAIPAIEAKPAETKPVPENLPPFIEAILKTFPSYESLYVDAQGGIYAPCTHSSVRGSATLYKNPYYK
jgi:hypothetical protein